MLDELQVSLPAVVSMCLSSPYEGRKQIAIEERIATAQRLLDVPEVEGLLW